jgi:chloramphenicol-sensitive protein RarD
VTVVPLLTFTLSIRRLPLLAVSFIQFLSPTVQMLIAITLLHESFDGARIAAFICIWLAVAIFVGDAIWQARTTKIPHPTELSLQSEPETRLIPNLSVKSE